jgi:hypothetical protein
LLFSVADLIHDFHAGFFKVANHFLEDYFRQDIIPRSVWIKHNLYLGYSVSLVSLIGILYVISHELWTISMKKQVPEKTSSTSSWTRFVDNFGTSHSVIWFLALIVSFPLLAWSKNCQYFS